LNLLEILEPHEHDILVSSIKKIKDNLEKSNHEVRGSDRPESTSKKNPALHRSEADRLIENLTNRSYSQAEKIQLEMDTLQRYFERWRELLSNSLTT
jgi:hypothetical protein